MEDCEDKDYHALLADKNWKGKDKLRDNERK